MKIIFFAIVLLAFIATGCGSERNKKVPDVSGIEVSLKFHRFDQDLFAIQASQIDSQLPSFLSQYGSFLELFGSRIINIGSTSSKQFGEYLSRFLNDYNMYEVYQECSKQYKDISSLEKSLTTAFKYYKHYFPEKQIPDIYLYMGGFNQSIVTAENILGIGLDKYLGSSFSYYQKLDLPSYQRYKMRADMIPADCFRAIGWSEFPFNDSIDNLLNNMIYQGKIQYFIDATLPITDDSVKFGFTTAQLEWCRNNEANIWTYLVEKKMLFTTDRLEIRRYIDDGPFTSTFPHESPGRTGVWLGWRIVCSYMDAHPEITLQQLLAENNYQKIMNQSKYKP